MCGRIKKVFMYLASKKTSSRGNFVCILDRETFLHEIEYVLKTLDYNSVEFSLETFILVN